METYLEDFKTGKNDPSPFSKRLGVARRILFSNKSKGFEHGGFKQLCENLKDLGAEWLPELIISIK